MRFDSLGDSVRRLLNPGNAGGTKASTRRKAASGKGRNDAIVIRKPRPYAAVGTY